MADLTILDSHVRESVQSLGIDGKILACEPQWADTAEFCAHYGVPAEITCNTIIVVVKSNPKRYVACLVRADSKLDVNHKVAAEVDFKRLSFASQEETAELSGMMIGGVTLIGLPRDIPILIDARVMEHPEVIVGGGNRSSKIRLAPKELLKLPNARVADVAIPR
jgi:prolyl-tRNA editing enzyme YbaK/EbsC (Cys-tRNA(Pro) deacylase)